MTQSCSIGTQAKVSRMTKTHPARQCHHALQAQSKQHHDEHIFQDALGVVIDHQKAERTARQNQPACPLKNAMRTSQLKGHDLFAGCCTRQLTHQALWPNSQHQRHGEKYQDQGGLGKKMNAKGVDTANQNGRIKSASNATQTAHDHHHKGFDHHLQIHLQMSRHSGQLQCTR